MEICVQRRIQPAEYLLRGWALPGRGVLMLKRKLSFPCMTVTVSGPGLTTSWVSFLHSKRMAQVPMAGFSQPYSQHLVPMGSLPLTQSPTCLRRGIADLNGDEILAQIQCQLEESTEERPLRAGKFLGSLLLYFS